MLFLKQNRVLIVIYILVVLLIIFGIMEYQKEYGYETRVNAYNIALDKCDNYDFEYSDNTFMLDYCNDLKMSEVTMDDTVTTFFSILFTKKLYYLSLFITFFIIVCVVSKVHKIMKDGYIKNLLLRANYFSVLKKYIFNCYKQVLVFLSFIGSVLIYSYFISGHFDYSLYSFVPNDFISKMPFSLIIFFLILGFHYIMYINIALICVKNNKNYYVSILASYLIWLALLIITEVILGGLILRHWLNLNIGESFNMLGIYTASSWKEMIIKLLLSITMAIGSFGIVVWSYKKKENVVMACERQN